MPMEIVDARQPHGAAAVARAAQVLAAGGIVIIPTDTVYGLAARADNPNALRRLFAAKGRPLTTPLPVLLPCAEALRQAAADVSPAALRLAEHFWPGPLTIVLPKSAAVSNLVTAGRDTVGLRMPDHPVALAVLRACPFLVAATSANLSAQPPATNLHEIPQALAKCVDLGLDGGQCGLGVPSTVVEVRGETVRVLRPGAVSEEEVRRALQG